MKTNPPEAPMRETLYSTAKATASCAQFKAGEYVSVKFSHFGNNGVAWYLIDRSQNGPLSQVVAYPASQLTSFCL